MVRPYIRGVVSRCTNIYTTRRCISSSTSATVQAAREHCLGVLRKHDVPSFLLKGYVPPTARDAFITLHALNVEIARVADTTSHPTVGAMRMQFWRNVVDKALAGSPPQEPVAIMLATVAEDLEQRTQGKSRLSKSWLHRIINTREQYLGNRPFPTLESLETYAENTYSTLLYLVLSAMPLPSLTTDHLASHIGKATGISKILRGLPLVAFPPPAPTHHTSNTLGGPMDSPPQAAVLLPLDVMAQTGVQEEEILRRGGTAPNLKDAVFTVSTRANDHIITAREMLKNLRRGQQVGHDFEHAEEAEHVTRHQETSGVDKQLQEVDRGFGALMPAISTSLWLKRLEKVDFDIFDRTLMRTDWKLPWKAYWAYNRGSF